MGALPKHRQDTFHVIAGDLSDVMFKLPLALLSWSTGHGGKRSVAVLIRQVREQLNRLEKELDT